PGAPSEALDEIGDATNHAGGYVESELRLTTALALVAGLRLDQLPGGTGLTLDPRAALAYRLDDWTVRLGGGLYHQGPWRVRYDLPDSGTPSAIPTEARHLAVGVQREGRPGFRAEAFLKDYDDYVPRGDGPAALAGRARGIDVLLDLRGASALEGWVSYSLLDSKLDLGGCLCVPSAVDVTHTLTGVGRLALGTAWELGATARYATGKPYTPVTGPAADGQGPEYGPVHSDRLPDYFRLDARLTRLLPAAGGMFVVYLEALNLLDRANVMAYTWDETYQDRRAVGSFFADRTLVLGVEAQF
ncbi:MAG: TonB-dependent receptor, partial [Gemmatimonadetes bacterium]|nr:TonB-dependent receptor [Gemmatimonadota bacterium]NIR75869.1 TonB-dependent receptor [Candidatus Kutchimonas denitrificans]NIS02036.1 TonB-dependent receptor [Gemmatimonadota bacterium]NIT67840.1 TonB-dependent receptor [Gemmatimonadota bacterium]NIU53826.1 TonB-dependent receptor [Gemmatimonadota bacterium]